jgi:hypothetical protein
VTQTKPFISYFLKRLPASGVVYPPLEGLPALGVVYLPQAWLNDLTKVKRRLALFIAMLL